MDGRKCNPLHFPCRPLYSFLLFRFLGDEDVINSPFINVMTRHIIPFISICDSDTRIFWGKMYW